MECQPCILLLFQNQPKVLDKVQSRAKFLPLEDFLPALLQSSPDLVNLEITWQPELRTGTIYILRFEVIIHGACGAVLFLMRAQGFDP